MRRGDQGKALGSGAGGTMPPEGFCPTGLLPAPIGQLISQYKHSSRTGITAPPAARIREAQRGRPGGEAEVCRGGRLGIIL